MLCVERLAAARAIPIDAHRFYTAKGPVTPPQFCRSLMAPKKRTAPVGQVVASGIIRAVTILKRVMAAKPFAKKKRGGLPGRAAAPFPRASPRANGPALPPALWLRNPQSAIRNPQSVSEIRNPYQKSVSYFFSPGRLQGIFMAGLIRNP